MMCRPDVGQEVVDVGHPARDELSIGIIARSASPLSTAAKTSSNEAQASASQSG